MIVFQQTQEEINEQFCMSCRQGNLKAVIELLDEYKADINCDAGYGLKKSCTFGHFELAKYIIHHPKFNSRYLEETLMNACEGPSFELVKYLIEDPQLSKWWDDIQDEFVVAALYKRKEVVDYFILEKNLVVDTHNLTVIKSHFSHNSQGKKWASYVENLVQTKLRYDNFNSGIPEKSETVKKTKI